MSHNFLVSTELVVPVIMLDREEGGYNHLSYNSVAKQQSRCWIEKRAVIIIFLTTVSLNISQWKYEPKEL